jgi:hypothetical protein
LALSQPNESAPITLVAAREKVLNTALDRGSWSQPFDRGTEAFAKAAVLTERSSDGRTVPSLAIIDISADSPTTPSYPERLQAVKLAAWKFRAKG